MLPILQSEYLRNVFEQYGTVSFVKYLRDKGKVSSLFVASEFGSVCAATGVLVGWNEWVSSVWPYDALNCKYVRDISVGS
jgi:hypothetical protein